MHQFLLEVPELVNWQAYMTRVRQSSQNAFYKQDGNSIGRVLNLRGRPRYVEVTPQDERYWRVSILGGELADEEAARALIRHMFSLDVDLQAFYTACANKPGLEAAIKHLRGARLLCDADVFASAISTIVSQQINLRFAAELKRRLWELIGTPVKVGEEAFYGDPLPEAVARLNYEDLQKMQFTRRKSEYIIDFARQLDSGQFNLDELAHLDDEEAIKKLCSLRGVGPWTAECILLFGLGRQDLLPAKDVGLQRGLTMSLGESERLRETEVRRRAENWRPWRSWATYYLWLAQDLPPGWADMKEG